VPCATGRVNLAPLCNGTDRNAKAPAPPRVAPGKRDSRELVPGCR
jgi:hypothetical protein